MRFITLPIFKRPIPNEKTPAKKASSDATSTFLCVSAASAAVNVSVAALDAARSVELVGEAV